jgi:N,N'-diacetyllegionaminate synthase
MNVTSEIASPKTLIIAEAGVNHDGDLEKARELVAAAASAGADYVKFQTFSARRLVGPDAAKAEYQKHGTGDSETQLEMLQKLELSEQDHQVLIDTCASEGIRFLSTPFDLEAVQLLDRLGIDRYKIPSGEITNIPFLRKIGSLGKPIILSTGMANLGEVETALTVLEEGGTIRDHITVLHCTTEYPTAPMYVNLRAMRTLGAALGVAIGYSDHTLGLEVSIAAVALGARVIEKHLTLDRSAPGPDHHASLEPVEFGQLVRCIRNVEQALGDGIKRPTPGEIANRRVARKSIVAASDVEAGQVLTEANLTTRRPEAGVSAAAWDQIVGKVASRSYRSGEPIQFETRRLVQDDR